MHAPTVRTLGGAIAGVVILASSSCAGARPGPRPDEAEPGGAVITREEIREMAVHTALDVLERSRTFLVIQRTRNGTPVRIYHRGVDSLLLNPEVLVVVDGVPVQDGIRALESIPAASIDFMQVLSGREGVMKWGSAAGNGVVSVRTSAR